MKTILLKVEVPDQVKDNEIEVTIPGASTMGIRVKAKQITLPSEEEIKDKAWETYNNGSDTFIEDYILMVECLLNKLKS